MHLLDVLAALLLTAAAAAFAFVAFALARADDVEAFYFLIVGAVALRSSVQVVRPGAGA